MSGTPKLKTQMAHTSHYKQKILTFSLLKLKMHFPTKFLPNNFIIDMLVKVFITLIIMLKFNSCEKP